MEDEQKVDEVAEPELKEQADVGSEEVNNQEQQPEKKKFGAAQVEKFKEWYGGVHN